MIELDEIYKYSKFWKLDKKNNNINEQVLCKYYTLLS